MKKIFNLAIIFFTAFVCGAVTNKQIQALEMQQIAGLSPDGYFDLGPSLYKIKAAPGETINRMLQVTSRNSEEMTYSISVEDYEGSSTNPNQSHVLLGDRASLYGAKDWTVPEINEINLKTGERVQFNVQIQIPENADAGEHYVSVLVTREPLPGQDKQGNNVTITSRIGTLFLIDVTGEVRKEGKLEAFKTAGNWPSESNFFANWYSKKPIEMEASFRNTGTTHLEPRGQIDVTNIFGQKVGEATIEPFNVLRGSVRNVVLPITNDKMWMGRYQATLTLNNTLGGTDVQTLSFYYFPLPLTLFVLGGILLIAVIGIVLLIRGSKKHVK